MTQLFNPPARYVPRYITGSGRYVSFESICGGPMTTVACVSNRMEIYLYVADLTFAVDQFALNVTAAVASALAKVVIFDCDDLGRPQNLLFESGDIDCASTGTRSASASFTFIEGTQYWVGLRSNSTQTVSAHPNYTVPILSRGTLSTSVFTALTTSLTYATAASAWSYSATQENNVVPIAVFGRIA